MAIEVLDALASISPNAGDIARLGGLSAIQAFISPTGEPLKSFMWEVHVLTGTADALPELTFYCKSAVIPDSQVDTIQVNYLGDKFTYPGKDASAKTVQLSFWDDQNFTVYQFFQNWINTLSTPVLGQQVSKKNATRTVVFELRDTTDLFCIARITLMDAFITTIGEAQLDYENTGIFTVNINLVYDRKIVGTFQDENFVDRDANLLSDITDNIPTNPTQGFA